MKKEDMKCGKVYKSDRPGKKVMQKVCKDGKETKIHAGDSAYPNNYSNEARKNFKARHNCSEAKPGTSKKLACDALWKKGGKVNRTGSKGGGK